MNAFIHFGEGLNPVAQVMMCAWLYSEFSWPLAAWREYE